MKKLISLLLILHAQFAVSGPLDVVKKRMQEMEQANQNAHNPKTEISPSNPAAITPDEIDIKSLKLGMSKDEVQQILIKELGGLDQARRNCDVKNITPTNELFVHGDVFIYCRGSFPFMGENVDLTTYFIDNKLQEVNLESISARTDSNGKLDVVTGFNEKLKTQGTYSEARGRGRRNFTVAWKSAGGSSLFVQGSVFDGEFGSTKVILIKSDYEEAQKNRINLSRQMNNDRELRDSVKRKSDM